MPVHTGAFSIFSAICVKVCKLQQPFGVNSIACRVLWPVVRYLLYLITNIRVLVPSDIVKSYAIFSHVMAMIFFFFVHCFLYFVKILSKINPWEKRSIKIYSYLPHTLQSFCIHCKISIPLKLLIFQMWFSIVVKKII